MGPDGTVYQGTLNGMTRYLPESHEALPAALQADAGVDQALDLLARSESDTPSSISERDYLRRALLQLVDTEAAAIEAGLRDTAAAAVAAMKSIDAAVASLDAGEPHDAQVDAAREVLSAL